MEVDVAPPAKAIKYGKALELHVKRKCVHEFKQAHLKFNCKDIGLVLFKQYCYLGASPDLIVECICSGKGVVEIKCLSSIAGEKPSYENYPHLKLQGKVTADLKKTVRIFIKYTDILYTQNMDQNSIIVGSKML